MHRKMLVRKIKLTRGKVALVDNENYAKLAQHKWYAAKTRYGYYAVRSACAHERGTTIFMHRVIMETPGNMDTDHINMNGLDNRQENLRICCRRQNQGNARKRSGTPSQYRGVSWDKSRSRWQAKIRDHGTQVFLGRYKSEDEAAIAYNIAALQVYGNFAKLNTISPIT